MKPTVIAAGTLLFLAAWAAGQDKPIAPAAKLAGEWKSGSHSLSIRRAGYGSGSLSFGGRSYLQDFRLKMEGDNAIVDVRIDSVSSTWKLTVDEDKQTMVMSFVEGKTKRDNITFTRDKAKEAAAEKAREAQIKTIEKALGQKDDGSYLFALEEVTGTKVINVTIGLVEGRKAAAGEIAEFLGFTEKNVKKGYQFIGRIEPGANGDRLAKAHQMKLQGYVAERLKKPVFSKDTCYSDLDPSSGKSINQKVAEGTCVRYYPLR